MNLDRHVNAHLRQFNHLVKGDDDSAEGHRKFYDEYLAVMDLTAEYYLQTMQVVFQEHLLPRGMWFSRGRKIDPSFIETALMTVEGELDDISGVGQTKAAHALTPNIPGPVTSIGSSRGSATTASSTAANGASRSCRGCATSSAPTRRARLPATVECGAG